MADPVLNYLKSRTERPDSRQTAADSDSDETARARTPGPPALQIGLGVSESPASLSPVGSKALEFGRAQKAERKRSSRALVPQPALQQGDASQALVAADGSGAAAAIDDEEAERQLQTRQQEEASTL